MYACRHRELDALQLSCSLRSIATFRPGSTSSAEAEEISEDETNSLWVLAHGY